MKLVDLTLPYASLSIMGLAKNVGKTTVLNHLIEAYRELNLKIGLTSIGRDGESTDVAIGTSKPEIYVTKGTLFATTEQLLNLCDVTKKIIDVTGITTSLGRVVLVQALSDGFIQLAGPSTNNQSKQIINTTLQHNVDKVIVDGSVGRLSLGSPNVAEAAILATGASLSRSQDKVIEKTVHMAHLFNLPQAPTDIMREFKNDSEEKMELFENYAWIKGALCDDFTKKKILSDRRFKDQTIIMDEASKCFLSKNMVDQLNARNIELMVADATNLLAITINPTSPYNSGFNAGQFEAILKRKIDVPIFNVKGD